MARAKHGYMARLLFVDHFFGIGTGPLSLSGVYSTCRVAAMGKSRLTGFWGDANGGGDFANTFKAAGYDIVLFEGKAEHPVYRIGS
jgi:aldehyde:ferredoxin oxidoreductase